jgi:hypothetical protein
MNKLLSNPALIMLTGAILIGIGADVKLASVWVPGAALAFIGFFMGCIWTAKHQNWND